MLHAGVLDSRFKTRKLRVYWTLYTYKVYQVYIYILYTEVYVYLFSAVTACYMQPVKLPAIPNLLIVQQLLLRGAIVNRTYGIHQNLHI